MANGRDELNKEGCEFGRILVREFKNYRLQVEKDYNSLKEEVSILDNHVNEVDSKMTKRIRALENLMAKNSWQSTLANVVLSSIVAAIIALIFSLF